MRDDRMKIRQVPRRLRKGRSQAWRDHRSPSHWPLESHHACTEKLSRSPCIVQSPALTQGDTRSHAAHVDRAAVTCARTYYHLFGAHVLMQAFVPTAR